MKKFVAFISLLFFWGTASLQAQVIFSQLHSSPTLINPALTGRFNTSYRVGGAYRRETTVRNQLFNKALFHADAKLLRSAIPEKDGLAMGISAFSERNGNDGIRNTSGSVSIAYQKGLDENGRQQLGIGFRATYANRQLIKPDHVLEDRLLSWLNAGYSIYDISTLTHTRVAYADLDAGLVYQGLFDPENYFCIGASMYHITAPRKIFQGGELNIPRETRVHADWERRGQNSRLLTGLLLNFKNATVSDLFLYSALKIGFSKIYGMYAGAGFRRSSLAGNAVVPLAGFSFPGFTLRLSYDIGVFNTNRIQRSSAELSLIYTHARSREELDDDRFIRF